MGGALLDYFKYRLKYKYAQHLPLTAPVDVSIELSSVCNQRCGYCYWSDPKNLPFEPGKMSLDVAMSILEQAAAIGVNSVKFNWKGEGTLNPNYRDITAYAKILARGSVFIDRIANSNFKISPKRRDSIFEGLANLTKVKVSYDSFDKKVFETQRAGGSHDLTTENIDLFYNHPRRIKSETRIVIQAVRTLLNKNEDILHKTKKRWPSAEVSIRDVVGGRTNDDVSAYLDKKRDVKNRQSCIQAHARVIFNHEGKALPCCPDIAEEHYIGHARNQTVKQIFNSPQAKRLRKDLISKKAFDRDPCKGCSSFESYKGYVGSWDS